MIYRVFWAPYAEEQLERIVLGAANPRVVANAAKALDRHLVTDPFGFSESRDDTVRVGFMSPLGVLFEVQKDVRTIIVLSAWRTDQK